MNPPEPTPVRSAGLREQFGLAIAVAAAFWAFVMVCGGDALLSRQMWMDEVHTWLLVSDADFAHSLTALAAGADYNPPGYYVLLRGFMRLSGVQDAAGMRLFSLLAMSAGLGLIAATLRRRHSVLVCLAAVVMVAVQPTVLHQATEARFYAIWFALVAAFCFVRATSNDSLAALLIQGVLAALMCTVHYFGVLSLGLICLLDLWNQRASLLSPGKAGRSRRVVFAAPYAAGVLALIGCTGFYLGQRSALTVPTWVSPATASRVGLFLLDFTPIVLLACALPGLVLTRSEPVRLPKSREPCLLLAGLGLPLVLIAFSLIVQPALVGRYATAGLIGWAAIAARLLHNARPGVVWLFLLVGIVTGADHLRDLQARFAEIESERNRIVAVLEAAPERVAMFEDRVDYFAMLARQPPGREWWLLDPDVIGEPNKALRTVQRDVARAVAKQYPAIRLSPLERPFADGESSVLLVAWRVDLAREDSDADEVRLRAEYPAFRLQRVARRVYRLRPRLQGQTRVPGRLRTR